MLNFYVVKHGSQCMFHNDCAAIGYAWALPGIVEK